MLSNSNDSKQLQQRILALTQLLLQKNLKITLAESCTGGGLAFWLTYLPGSSAWFDRGFVTYSNAAKTDLLGVNAELLENMGPVNAETASAMAVGALQHSHAQISLSITGVAGPDGGTALAPVGTVWFGLCYRSGVRLDNTQLSNPQTKKCDLKGDRTAIREQAILRACEWLIDFVATL